jgi:AcrR family transcriptional regulator
VGGASLPAGLPTFEYTELYSRFEIETINLNFFSGSDMTAQAWATARSSKRPRLSRDALREHVLDTAVKMLDQTPQGLTVSLAHLNMEELIRIADVPRSSVYREWDTKEAFHVDLMYQLIEPIKDHGAAWDAKTLQIAKKVIRDHKDMLDTAEGRRAVLCEAVHKGVRHNFAALKKSRSWRTAKALMATLPTLEEDARHHISDALTESERRFIDKMSEFYDEVMPALSLRMKEPFNTKMLAAAASSVVEGLVDRSRVNADVIDTPVNLPGLDGRPTDWHLAAVSFLAIVDAMTVEIPPGTGKAE